MSKFSHFVLKTGSYTNFGLYEDQLTEPGKNQVQVAVKAVGLNFADMFALMGLYSATPKVPFVPGLEFSGVVKQVGASCTRFKAGDHVMGCTRFGGYSTVVNVDERYAFRLPESWGFEDGASFLVTALTAYYGLVVLGNAQAGDLVLIHSGGGGVGLWANWFAK